MKSNTERPAGTNVDSIDKDEVSSSASIAVSLLLAAVLVLLIIWGVVKFSIGLYEDIKYKEEINSLTKEKLRLEIQLKKRELSTNSR